MATITVFTPTYNRAHTLHRTYESLKRQTNHDFIWLIVDDGSTDCTKELVDSWLKDTNSFEIKYYYKFNGGMHTAHNFAYRKISSELAICIDSDDYLTDDAIEIILYHWNKYGNETLAGLVGLDAFTNGKVIGESFNTEIGEKKFREIHRKFTGDKKFVYRTKIFNEFPPYPEFEDEKLTPLSLKYYLIDQKYSLLTINKVLCVVEYQEDGSSKNIISSYKKNIKGFLELRKVTMQLDINVFRRFISTSQYVMGNLQLKRWNFIKQSPNKLMTILATPFGVALLAFVYFTKNKCLNKKI